MSSKSRALSSDSSDLASGKSHPASKLPSIGIGTGLWISPAGMVISLAGSHVNEIIAWPTRFGTRTEHLLAIHERFGERLHVEGRARHHIIRAVLFTGWIRLRHQRNYWSVSVDDLDLRRPTIQAFFHAMLGESRIGIHGEIQIYSVRDETLHTLEVCELLEGFDPADAPMLSPGRTEAAEELPPGSVPDDFSFDAR